MVPLSILQQGTVGIHDVYLVTALIVDLRPIALEYQLLVIKAPIRLRIIPAEGQLSNISQMHLTSISEGIGGWIVPIFLIFSAFWLGTLR